MTWDEIAGRWTAMRGRLRERWGRLTHDDGSVISGQRDQLIGTLLQRYSSTVDEIEQQIGSFERQVVRGR
jgi:uncharacterized protein YjbJ (UPF0337 family)